MKIPHRSIEKDGEGQVAIVTEDSDDLWLVYNIIQRGDQLRAPTWRKIVNESSTGSTGAHRVKLTLTLSVERVEYDSESNIIKVKGKSIEENRHVRKGQYHTIDLELNKKFYLTKPVWDRLALAQLNEARDCTRNAEVAVVIMQEGLAYICLLTTNMTIQKAKIEVNIPRKRKNFCSQHQKGMESFYEQTLQAMLNHINFDVIKCVLIASPGFVKDQFAEYMWNQAAKHEMKQLLESRQKFLLAHSSTGFKHSIREVLSDPLIQPKLEDTKAVQEVKIWNKFQDLLGTEPGKAVYGLRDVELANHYEAISCMMLSDTLFRSNNLALRKKYSNLIDQVKRYGSDVKIFSSMHFTGQQLNLLTGIAAVLKYEVPELNDRLSAMGNTAANSSSSSSSSSSDSSEDQDSSEEEQGDEEEEEEANSGAEDNDGKSEKKFERRRRRSEQDVLDAYKI